MLTTTSPGVSPYAAFQGFEHHRSIAHSRSQIPGQDIYHARLARGHIIGLLNHSQRPRIIPTCFALLFHKAYSHHGSSTRCGASSFDVYVGITCASAIDFYGLGWVFHVGSNWHVPPSAVISCTADHTFGSLFGWTTFLLELSLRDASCLGSCNTSGVIEEYKPLRLVRDIGSSVSFSLLLCYYVNYSAPLGESGGKCHPLRDFRTIRIDQRVEKSPACTKLSNQQIWRTKENLSRAAKTELHLSAIRKCRCMNRCSERFGCSNHRDYAEYLAEMRLLCSTGKLREILEVEMILRSSFDRSVERVLEHGVEFLLGSH
ncbi:hypothetical protein VNO77_19995 [Canavalia gladiata]|uniref:Uncharacterized protein n=1 Tax=Canavalia gladiata TaxID=3824 RepID=A0AAN9QKW6_CANGL